MAVMIADEPDSPACFGMFVSYDSVNGLSSRGLPLAFQYSENCGRGGSVLSAYCGLVSGSGNTEEEKLSTRARAEENRNTSWMYHMARSLPTRCVHWVRGTIVGKCLTRRGRETHSVTRRPQQPDPAVIPIARDAFCVITEEITISGRRNQSELPTWNFSPHPHRSNASATGTPERRVAGVARI